MNQSIANPFVRLSIKALFGIVFVAAFYSLLARQLGFAAVLPWVVFLLFCTFLFLVGRWLVKGIEIARHVDPTTPSRIASFENSYEASILVAKLADFGIPATTTGTYTSGFQAESPGLADVFVSKEDLPAAIQVMDGLPSDNHATGEQ